MRILKRKIFWILLCSLAVVSTALALNDTNTAAPDFDLDGLSDNDEVSLYGTNPQLADTDGDSLVDGVEVFVYHTDPRVSDAQQSETIVIPSNSDGMTPISDFPSTPGRNIHMSGNGRYVVYTGEEVNMWYFTHIHIYDRVTNQIEVISRTPDIYPLSISNDGRYVFYKGRESLYQFSCSGPDDEGINDIQDVYYVYDRQTGTTKSLIQLTQLERTGDLVISGDGSTFVFQKETFDPVEYCGSEGYLSVPDSEIYAYNTITDTYTPLPLYDLITPNSEFYITDLDISDNGQRIAITVTLHDENYEQTGLQYYLFDLSMNALTQITAQGNFTLYGDARISGDGGTIEIDSLIANQSFGFYFYNVASGLGNYEPVPTNEFTRLGVRVGSMSADGNILALNNTFSTDPSAPPRVGYIYDRNTQSLVQLPLALEAGEEGAAGQVSSDGTQILYTTATCPQGDCITNHSSGEISAFVYEYTPPEIVDTLPPGGMTTTTLTQARGWSKLQWLPVEGAQWYHVWLGDYAGYTHDQWYEAPNVCGDTICATPDDFWLANGTYHWWMTHWSPGSPNYEDNYSETVFTVNVNTPGMVERISTSQNVISSTDPNTILTWDNDPKASWYRLYIGDGQTATFDSWYKASDVCSGAACSVQINLPAGSHEWWMTSWGPGGYAPWNTEAFIVTVSG